MKILQLAAGVTRLDKVRKEYIRGSFKVAPIARCSRITWDDPGVWWGETKNTLFKKHWQSHTIKRAEEDLRPRGRLLKWTTANLKCLTYGMMTEQKAPQALFPGYTWTRCSVCSLETIRGVLRRNWKFYPWHHGCSYKDEQVPITGDLLWRTARSYLHIGMHRPGKSINPSNCLRVFSVS